MSEVDRLVESSSLRYDRRGEQHYLLASALQKSIRGSHSDAALYYLGRMPKGGEDPAFIGTYHHHFILSLTRSNSHLSREETGEVC